MPKKKNGENEDIINYIITIIGDSNSGKIEIITKFMNQKADTKSISTIGFVSFNKEITLKDGSSIKLNVIDTAGQENYKALLISYIKNSDGILFVFSHDDGNSFEFIKDNLMALKSVPSIDFKNNKPAYLVGNNCDLEHVIDDDEIIKLKKECNLYGYIDINFKDDNNINELFSDMGEILFKIYENSVKKENVKLAAKHKKNNINCNFILSKYINF